MLSATASNPLASILGNVQQQAVQAATGMTTEEMKAKVATYEQYAGAAYAFLALGAIASIVVAIYLVARKRGK